MAFQNASGPCDVWRENYANNSGSFGTSNESDDWRQVAGLDRGIPCRAPNPQPDTTAYASVPTQAHSWNEQLHGTCSPANTAGRYPAGAVT